MKHLTTLLLLFFSGLALFAQNATDIKGQWQSTKAGAELFIEINGANATITSVGKTSLTPKVVGGSIYQYIAATGNNTWSAQRNAWMYTGIGGINQDGGHWEKANKLTLTLSEDGNTLTASGHWTYKRVGIMGSATIEKGAGKQNVSFGGIKAMFFTSQQGNGASYVNAQFKNTTTDRVAQVSVIQKDGSLLEKQVLLPRAGFSSQYRVASVVVEVSYLRVETYKYDPSLLDKLKEAVRRQVTSDKKRVIVKPLGPNAQMGVRG